MPSNVKTAISRAHFHGSLAWWPCLALSVPVPSLDLLGTTKNRRIPLSNGRSTRSCVIREPSFSRLAIRQWIWNRIKKFPRIDVTPDCLAYFRVLVIVSPLFCPFQCLPVLVNYLAHF
jgi:hypothetical protein